MASTENNVEDFSDAPNEDISNSEPTTTGPEQSESDLQAVERIIRNETKSVFVWKSATLLTILLTAVVVPIATYRFLSENQNNDFVSNYDVFVRNIRDATVIHRNDLFSRIRDFSMQVTKEAQVRGETFPWVTVPMYEVMGRQNCDALGLEGIDWAPLVHADDMDTWFNYSYTNQGWLQESRMIALKSSKKSWEEAGYDNITISGFVFDLDHMGQPIHPTNKQGPWQPIWQFSPPLFFGGMINYNILQLTYIKTIEDAISEVRQGLFTEVRDFSHFGDLRTSRKDHEEFHNGLVKADREEGYDSYKHPHARYIVPVFEKLHDDSSAIVGHIFAFMTWDRYLVRLLPDGVAGITAVVRNSCGQNFTYDLDGSSAFYRGEGDVHDAKYDDYEMKIPFYDENDEEKLLATSNHCLYAIHVYPTDVFVSAYKSNAPMVTTAGAAMAFAFLVLVFLVYDYFVHQRNAKIKSTATQYNALLSSLFPSNVRDRLLESHDTKGQDTTAIGSSAKPRINNFLQKSNVDDQPECIRDEAAVYKTKPIADLFAEITVLFADIVGFTAWSSMRDPTQVFILLETIFKAFDDIAKARRIFKVETVGDCYVAAAGLPDARKDHAVIMSRFALDCMLRMRNLLPKLEVILGPDTSELDMRFGLHSGPVTAGVLRGERSRFQLFGDTMNTASRMESNGKPGMIHLSQETADLLIAAGKSHWITPRQDKIVAKGKGELQTYWLCIHNVARGKSNNSGGSSQDTDDVVRSEDFEWEIDSEEKKKEEKTERLIQWHVETLLEFLRQVVNRRKETVAVAPFGSPPEWISDPEKSVLDECCDVIEVNSKNADRKRYDSGNDNIDPKVAHQLKEYVSAVSKMYLDVPFHNFEHASHVTMSTVKLLSRMASSSVNTMKSEKDSNMDANSFGIMSDPLTQFACVFSSLIHDVNHPGIPNSQLRIENLELSAFYKNRSIAEQNSVDLAWKLLQDDEFLSLRRAIYQTEAEMFKFRQLVVNLVMATDLMDKGLQALRNVRWDMAFSNAKSRESLTDTNNRKATIVIECLIQASDVSHTMQHWHVYSKWNERLFSEMYSAYKAGRAQQDPSGYWYKGEMDFFDSFVIPLAKKLKQSGVFGSSVDEYLNYAERNRKEWEGRGRGIVTQMKDKIEQSRKLG